MKRSLTYFWLLCTVLCSSLPARSVPPGSTPLDSYIRRHNLAITLATSAYFSTIESNGLSAKVDDWQLDGVTVFNFLWRTAVFSHLKNWEIAMSYQRGLPWFFGQLAMQTIRATFSALTFQMRDWLQGETNPDGEGKTEAQKSFGLNLTYFYLHSFLWSFPWNLTLRKFVLPDGKSMTQTALNVGGENLAKAMLVFSVYDTLVQHLTISLKHFINNLPPTPAKDSWGGFPDCTSCFFGTNIAGSSGVQAGAVARWLGQNQEKKKEEL